MENDFNKYLYNLGISAKSHKNYRSDLSHFKGWLILKIRSFGSFVETLSEAIPFLSNDLAKEYKGYMVDNDIAFKTINRRLSTLRHLSRFLTSTQVIDANFMNDIENITNTPMIKISDHPMIHEFKSYLESEKISKNTIKNYLSDTRQFLVWLENNHAHFA